MGKQYLTFKLADTVYAVNVFQVREVLSYTPPQPLPKSDPVIEGLIRSRGQSIPVVNLRRKFSLAEKPADAASRIIVVEVNNYEEGSISVFGAVADSVNEVVDLDTIGFEDTPELGNSPASAFIEGIGRQGEAFVIILDVDKIFSFSELSEMNELDNRTVAPEYAKYTQELPPQHHEQPKPEAQTVELPPVVEAMQPVEQEPQAIEEKPTAPPVEFEAHSIMQAEEEAEAEADVQEEPLVQAAETEEVPKPSPEELETPMMLAEEAGSKEVLPAIKTPPVSVPPLEDEPAQEEPSVEAEPEGLLYRATQAYASIAQRKVQASSVADQSASATLPQEEEPEKEASPPMESDLEESAAQAQKEPSQEDDTDGGYDALDFATEDFELL